MILVGLFTLIVGQLLLVLVGSEWTFVLPGIVYGAGHALLVPSTIAAGSRVFPNRHRGLGTTLILSMFDVGNLVGAPMAGAIVHFGGAAGLPGYPIMFVSVAAALGLVGVVYGLTRRAHPARAPKLRRLHGKPAGAPAGESPLVEVGTEA